MCHLSIIICFWLHAGKCDLLENEASSFVFHHFVFGLFIYTCRHAEKSLVESSFLLGLFKYYERWYEASSFVFHHFVFGLFIYTCRHAEKSLVESSFLLGLFKYYERWLHADKSYLLENETSSFVLQKIWSFRERSIIICFWSF